MSGLVLQRLDSKFTRKNNSTEKNIDHNFIEKVVGEVKFMLAKSMNANDVAALKMVASSISSDVYRFFSETSDPRAHTNNVMESLVKYLAQKNLYYMNSTKKYVQKPVSCEHFRALQQSIPELRDLTQIYKYSASGSDLSVAGLHEMLIDPQIIEPKDQALLLLTGNKLNPNSEHFKLGDLDENVRTNKTVDLFSRVFNPFRIKPSMLTSEEQKHQQHNLPEHYLGVQYLSVVYVEAIHDTKQQFSLESLASESMHLPNIYLGCLPDRELHIKKLTGSNSLRHSIDTYLSHMGLLSLSLEERDNGSIDYGSRRSIVGIKNFLLYLNEDAFLTRIAVKHIDKLCNFLYGQLGNEKVSRVLPSVIDKLQSLFSRKNYLYINRYGSTHESLVARSCVDMPLPGISKILCTHLRNLHHDVINNPMSKISGYNPANDFAKWIAQHLPDASIHYIAKNSLADKELLKPLIKDSFIALRDFTPNPEYKLKHLAKLMATVERHHPKLFEGSSLSNHVDEVVRDAEKSSELQGLYAGEFQRQYYRDFASVSGSQIPEKKADMSFLINSSI